jgi:predicted component of type VI protein secretion system
MLLKKFYRDKRKATELTSVIANLNHMLNTKKGFGSWLPKYGIGDYNEFRAREKIVATLIQEIQENVSTYEPRVKINNIAEVPSDSPFRLRFQMKAVFLEDTKPIFIIVDSLRSSVTIEG